MIFHNSLNCFPELDQARNKQILTALSIAALAFFAYTSVYAFRKPFTVARFEGQSIFGISYQTALIISQVIGYMLSKFAGIRFISALRRTGRWKTGSILVGLAWFSLLLFALVPPWLGLLCFLVNGFMLGFLWGVVFSYAEGRRATDFIGSVLAVSFIFAGGFTRSVAKWLLLEQGITENWMPFMTGLVFALPLAIFLFLLERMPPPDADDVEERAERISMDDGHRREIWKTFGKGLLLVAAIYTMLTIMRDLRDNYMGNMWTELGYGTDASVFTRSETTITLVILLVMSLVVLVRRNMLAFQIMHGLIITGFLITGLSSLLFIQGGLQGSVWMVLAGLGLYMAYIPFNAIFFERMIAAFRMRGNVGFLIYITDAFGYLGSVLVMLVKEVMKLELEWSAFYSRAAVLCSCLGLAGTVIALIYFTRKHRKTRILS
jgi:MFS family permease